MPPRRALVTGIGGQDGSCLAELLLERDYEVFGIVRHGELEDYENLAAVRDQLRLVRADVLDQPALTGALQQCRPHEVYNLASVSFVPASWDQPVLTAEFAAVGVTVMLEAIRAVDLEIRFYQASSSEIFGEPSEAPQGPETPLSPLTPYGVAKAYGHMITRSYRRRYGLHASTGILYNHESPRRPLDFLPRKVTRGAAEIADGLCAELGPRRPRGTPRLGLRARLRARYVVDAPAGRTRGICRSHGRNPQRPRAGRNGLWTHWPRLAYACANRRVSRTWSRRAS
jgi:GDPmannose 4,6-dehydratase